MLTMLRDYKSSRVQNAYFPPFPKLLPALKCELYTVIKEPWNVKAAKKALAKFLLYRPRDQNTLRRRNKAQASPSTH